MKYRLLVFFAFFLITGCGSSTSSLSSDVQVISNDIHCVTSYSDFVLTFENGHVVKYVDSIDGELIDIIDILNDEHFSSISNNDDAISIMSNVISELGGYCEKKE